MSDQDTSLSPEFIEQQRQRLQELLDQHHAALRQKDAEERSYHEVRSDEAQEFEEQAQDMAQDEVHQALHDAEERHLGRIERALQKIAEGTYGRSDLSGEPIPRARLETVPEAIFTSEEEERQAPDS
jgi:DnaK suppressor protein